MAEETQTFNTSLMGWPIQHRVLVGVFSTSTILIGVG
jgi:hypothetical protein